MFFEYTAGTCISLRLRGSLHMGRAPWLFAPGWQILLVAWQKKRQSQGMLHNLAALQKHPRHNDHR